MAVKQSSQRISYVGSIVWLMGFGLLAMACVSIAMSLPMPSRDVSGVVAWIQQHQTALQMADENVGMWSVNVVSDHCSAVR